MRIAYLCSDPGVPITGSKGASVHVRETCRALRQLGHDVRVLAVRRGDGPSRGLRLHELPLTRAGQAAGRLVRGDPQGGPGTSSALRSLLAAAAVTQGAVEPLRRWRPHLIYERYALFGTAGVEVSHLLGVPLVLEVNAPLSKEHAVHRALDLATTARAVEREVLTAADRVVAVSEPLRRWLIDLGVPARRIRVLPNGVDADRFRVRISRVAARRQLGVEPDELVVGFAGSLRRWHDVDGLIDAVARVRARKIKVTLVVVGDGPERARLERHGRRRLGNGCRFLGAVPHEAMPRLLAGLDVAAAPYADASEEFYFSPLKVVEYLAAARPVVAANVGPIRHCIRPGRSGWLYPPGDPDQFAEQLKAALAAPDAEVLGAAGRRHAVAKHSWRSVAAKAVHGLVPTAA